MTTTVIHLPGFVSDWKHFRLTDEDLQALETLLMKAPDAGPVMAGTGGIRKIRFSAPSRHAGKSGGFRVSYLYLRVGDRIVLLSIFAKNDKDNLTAAEKAEFRKIVEWFK